MKIVMTGGHFSPAHSIIQKIKKDNEILVVGRKYAFEGDTNKSYEYEACKEEGISFKELRAGRLQRKLTVHTIPSILRFPKGVIDAMWILNDFRPDAVVTFGGYLGLPVAMAASFLRIPVVLHEQTQKAGLSARLISGFASVVLVSFDSSKKYFKNKNIVVTGNPLRREIVEIMTQKSDNSRRIIYITGGSTGSHAINEAVYGILPRLLQDFTVVHQTGSSKKYNDYQKMIEFKKTLDEKYKGHYIVSEFFSANEVARYMTNALLVVSRSGVNTVLELMAIGNMAILIPLPHGQQGEQRENALLFEQTGLGVMLGQEDLTGEGLYTLIRDMINNREKYIRNKKNASKYVHLEALDSIIKQIYQYGERRSQRKIPPQEA